MAEKVIGSEKINFYAFRKHENIRKAIGSIIPGIYKLITMDREKEGFQISGRTFHGPQFATADEKSVFTLSLPRKSMNGSLIALSMKRPIHS